MSRNMTATVNGAVYVIPEVCIMGFQTGHPGATVQDAIDWWVYQDELSKLDVG